MLTAISWSRLLFAGSGVSAKILQRSLSKSAKNVACAYVIEGYTRQGSSVDRAAHAWCTVYTDHRWRLYDPTWDASVAAAAPFRSRRIFFRLTLLN